MNFSVFAPASIGNVASGFDVLGLAVEDLGDLFHFEPASRYSITVSGRDRELVPLDPLENTVTMAAEAFYRQIAVPSQAFHVHIQRALPLAGGLGSSAASSVAGAMAAAHLADADQAREAILRAALHAESVVAGPHLDNIAPCYFGGLTLIQDSEQLLVYPIPLAEELAIVLVTPALQIKTRDARRVLPEQLKTADWTRQMAHCTTLALALARGDREHLTFGMIDTFAEPARSVLIPGFYEAKKRVMERGAYGFSISGSGPTCFALCPDPQTAAAVAEALQNSFGPEARVHLTKARQQGAELRL